MAGEKKESTSQNHRKSGSAPHKTNIQYVAKVRYSNTLPPPLCPPKLLKDETSDGNDNGLDNLVSSFFRKENFRNLIRLDEDLGMPLNLISLPKKETVYGLPGIELHPEDAVLLTDPTKRIKTKSESVSFLRRTQYISSGNQSGNTGSAGINQTKVKSDELDPKTQLKVVEDMFDVPSVEDVTKFQHPTKKHLKARKVWNFLPDTSMFDQQYYDVKFMSSASISKSRDKNKDSIRSMTDPRLLTAIFREIEVNKNTKLTSFYVTDVEEANKVQAKLADETENAPMDDAEVEEILKDESKRSIYKRQREYDGSVKELEPLRHLVITFDDKTQNAYYIPVAGKLELKKCRIDPYLAPKIKEMTYDQINMHFREPTRGEIEQRDIMRSDYDPMEFGADDE